MGDLTFTRVSTTEGIRNDEDGEPSVLSCKAITRFQIYMQNRHDVMRRRDSSFRV